MKKFFKHLFIGAGSIILLAITVGTIWWNTKSDNEKSDLMLAAHQYDAAIEYNQNNSEAWMERSVAWNKSGDFNEGFKYLNKAVKLEPVKHLGYRGWIRLRKMRDYDNALMDLNRLDSLTPKLIDAPWGEDIDFLRGECHYGNKDYQNAIKAFNQSVTNQKEDWADIHTFVYLGLCEYELGNLEKAVSEFQRALAQSENICEAHFGLAKTYQKLENFSLSKKHIEKAEKAILYKRDDSYNEYLNEIYLSEILAFKQNL